MACKIDPSLHKDKKPDWIRVKLPRDPAFWAGGHPLSYQQTQQQPADGMAQHRHRLRGDQQGRPLLRLV